MIQQLISQNTNLLQSYQNLSNLTSTPFAHLNYQTSLLQAKNAQLLLLKNAYFQNQQLLLKQAPSLQMSPQNLTGVLAKPQVNCLNPTQLQNIQRESNYKSPCNLEFSKNFNVTSFGSQEVSANPLLNTNLRTQLEGMVRIVLSSVNGKTSGNTEATKLLYKQNPILVQIFDKLVMKYYSAKKCREDIVRYILRKAFKTFRSELVKNDKITHKKASLALCKKYFHSRVEEIEKAGVNIESEEALFDFIMPYKKNSKNRTMNTNFVTEIFASTEFAQAYEHFLTQFESLLNEDNDKKIEKMVDLLVICVQNNDISKLNTFNRLPWLDVWLADTMEIATSLIPKNFKSPKCEGEGEEKIIKIFKKE